MILIFILLFLPLPSPSCADETKLNNHLQNITNKFVRPVHDYNTPVTVTFGFELVHIVSINENEQSMKIKVWLRMSWINELLTWKPSEWNDIEATRMNYAIVWTPDIFLEQDVSEEVSTGPVQYKTQINCHHDGKHQWFVPVLITSSCLFDVRNFPYDRQTCQLKFLSWSYSQKELNITIDPRPVVTTNNYVVSAEWKLLHIGTKLNVKKYECCADPFVDVLYTIEMDRRPMYYMYNAILPCIIQMVIIMFTFFLPPESGERIGIVITVLLVFAVYLDMISGDLPNSSSVPALSTFYLASMAACSCSLIATCFTLIVHFKGAEKGVRPLPEWVRNLFLGKIGRFVGIGKLLRKYSNSDLLALNKSEGTEYGGFLQFPTNNNDGTDTMKNKTRMYSRRDTHNSLYSQCYDKTDKPEQEMSELVEEVRIITKLIHDQNLQDEVEEEWQVLAKVMDRIFCACFFCVFAGLSAVLLLPVYTHQTSKHQDH